MALRILFFGTPSFAVPSLVALAASGHEIAGVITQPDRPRGRGHRVTAEAVKLAAVERGLPVLQPLRLNTPEALESIAALDADLGVVAAYGKILPAALLAMPRLGCINVHASLLPRWRGAAPVHRAILAGDTMTGVTIMRVVQALDAGPALDRVETNIDPDENSLHLEQRLATLGAELLAAVVGRLARGPVPETTQDEAGVTYAHRLTREDSPVRWDRPADEVHNHIRGLHPWPLASSTLNGRRLLLLRAAMSVGSDAPVEPGTVVHVDRAGVDIATRPGAIRLLELQEEGRAAMAIGAYLNGRPIHVGDRFTSPPASI